MDIAYTVFMFKDGVRPTDAQVRQIRSWILSHLRQLFQVAERIAPEEFEAILNYLSTTNEVFLFLSPLSTHIL